MDTSRLAAALEHAARGFYVFPLLPGKKTPPKGMHFKALATRDPAQITAWWAERDWNIGIFTGRFAEGEALLVVDVDNKGDKHGDEEVLRLELEGWELPGTLTCHTPTGGRHLFYRVGAPVRQGANILGPGVDVRSRGGYVVAAGSAVGPGAYRLGADEAVAAAPDWLVERCGRARDPGVRGESPAVAPASARERAEHYLANEAPASLKGQGGDSTAFAVACRVKDLGVDEATCLELMLGPWNDRSPPGWAPEKLRVKVRNAYHYGALPQGSAAPEADFAPVAAIDTSGKSVDVPDDHRHEHPFEKLNREFAFVLAGGGAHILWETTDHNGIYKLEHLASGAYHAKFAAHTIQVGKRSSPVTEEWLRWKGRRSYDGLVFMPGREAPERFYNLWRGFAVLPSDSPIGGEAQAALDAFLAHTRDNICRGDEALTRWLMGFFAHLVQRPWEKPLVALVFRGGKGVGKNALVGTIGALLGGHSLVTSNRRYLVGNFNGHLESLLLFTLDEAFWSGDKQAEGQLKDLITGDHHVIEHKGKEPYKIANLTRICVIGNEDWLVPASHDERRFAVFDVGDGRKQDRSFFQAMREGMEAGGNRLLLRYLMDFDLRGIDLNGAPATRGLMDQKNASLEAFPAWWLTCLQEGRLIGGDFEESWPREVDRERLRNAFRRHAKERGVRGAWLPDDRSMGRQLKKFAPSVNAGRLQTGHTYKMPTLDAARADWGTYIGHSMDWE